MNELTKEEIMEIFINQLSIKIDEYLEGNPEHPTHYSIYITDEPVEAEICKITVDQKENALRIRQETGGMRTMPIGTMVIQ